MDAVDRHPTPPDGVVATAVPSPWWVRGQLVLYVLLLVVWGGQAVVDPDPLAIGMTVLTAVGVALQTWMVVSGPRVELVLTEDRLELRRRVRPLSLARAEVLAVRGDVDGRPSWSQEVLLETPDRTVRLPPLEPGPGELVPRLQRWAGVGEQPRP